MRLIAGISLLWMMGANAFALSGTVKDSKGAAIAGALVSLVSDTSARSTTGADGTFKIDKPVSINGRAAPFVAGRSFTRLILVGDRLPLSIPAPAHAGVLALFSSDGKKRLERKVEPSETGTLWLSMSGLEPGLYHMLISGDGDAPAGARNGSALRRMAAASVDTLLVRKAGFATARSPLASYDQAGIAIVMEQEAGGVSTLPPTTDYDAAGPFKAVQESNVGPGSAYTIFRPETLGKDGFLHSPIIFGFGINADIQYGADFLKRVAAHGFVIIACNKLTGAPGSAQNLNAMTTGLNWLLQQNSTAGSKFQGKLAITRAASMGYSVGGTSAVDIGEHQAVITVVSLHGHASDAVLHGPLMQTSGTKDNVGLPLQQQTFDKSKVQTIFSTVVGASHDLGTGLFAERPAAIAWLRYWLYNDQGAKHYFYGDDCVMCKSPWTNPQRKNWQ